MNSEYLIPDNMRINPDKYDERLLSFLRLLVSEHGPMTVAEMLGVNYKTVARSLERQRLSKTITDALTRVMLSDANPVVQQLVEDVRDLRGSVGELAGRVAELAAVPDQGGAELKAFREDHNEAMRLLGQRITVLENRPGGSNDSETSAGRGSEQARIEPAFDKKGSTRGRRKPWFPLGSIRPW